MNVDFIFVQPSCRFYALRIYPRVKTLLGVASASLCLAKLY